MAIQRKPSSVHLPETDPSAVDLTLDEAELNRRRRDYAVYPVIRHQAVTIIGGPSQVGKTTLMMQIIEAWLSESKVFGCDSYPAPACLVTTLEPEAEMREAARRAGIEDDDLPILTLTEKADRTQTFPELCRQMQERSAEQAGTKLTRATSRKSKSIPPARPEPFIAPRVVFLEGIHNLLPGEASVNNYRAVSKLMKSIRFALKTFDMTLVATGRCSKAKESTSQTRTIDRFLGSTAWTEGCYTFIGVEHMRPNDDQDKRRVITVSSKSCPTIREYRLFASTGMLVMNETEAAAEATLKSAQAGLITWASAFPSGQVLTFGEIADAASDFHLSKSTCRRLLPELFRRNLLVQVSHGKYRVPWNQ